MSLILDLVWLNQKGQFSLGGSMGFTECHSSVCIVKINSRKNQTSKSAGPPSFFQKLMEEARSALDVQLI